MAPKLSEKNCNFFQVPFVPEFPDLDAKKTLPITDVCLESLGAMLEYFIDLSNIFVELSEINVRVK